MILYLPTELKFKYNNRIIGFIWHKDEKYYLIAGERKMKDVYYIKDLVFTHLHSIAVRCEKCGKILERPVMPALVFLVDRLGTHIKMRKVDPNGVYAVYHCAKCEYKIMSRVASPVICKQCNKVITWLYPQSNHNFEIKIGKKYHIEACNACNPRIRNELVEYKEAVHAG